MKVGTFRLRRLLPVAALAAIAVVWVPLSGAAQQASVCDQAIAEAGTGQGTYGRYTLIQAPEVGRSGSQVVVGTAGADRLVGGSGNDVLCGLGGDDTLDGGSGNDQLEGGDGADVLYGASGNDVLDGGPGFDQLFGGSGNDTLSNGEVNDGGSGQNQVVPPAPPLATDISSSMPRTMRDDLPGDFLGRGYDQRMRAEGSNLNIYDSAALGGALLQSASMDLSIPGGGVDCGFNFPCEAVPWAEFSQESTQACDGCFATIWSTFDLATIYLAQNNSNIFMSGVKGNAFSPLSGETQYENLLYVLPKDGSCASQSCAISTVSLPNAFNLCGSCGGLPRAIQVTSLAAGSIGGTPYLAVGLSDNGVQIYNVSDPSAPQLTGTFGGIATGDGSQTPPTALAWDPSGSGLLAIGVMSWADEGFFVQINANGTIPGSWLAWNQHGGTGLGTVPFAAAFGQRQDGTPVVAFGMNNGVQLVDPLASGAETGTLAQLGGAATIAINPIPRFDGSAGGSDFAVSYQTVPAPTFGGQGGLLRWDGTANDLTALPVSAGATPPSAPIAWEGFRQWYPGIKQGRLQVNNTSGEPIEVTLQTGSDSSSGCWYAPSWADAPAFPSAGVTVAAGETSSYYTMGAYTAGSDGSCAPPAGSSGNDLWRGYLVVKPVNRHADTQLVRLRLNTDMTVDVDDDQAGGTTSVSIAQAPQHLAAFGLWTLTVDTPAAPTPLAAPTVAAATVAAAQVTASGAPVAAVYRFDVTGATFQLPNPYADQIVVPPLIVQGFDGTSWIELGALVPAMAPTIVAHGSGFVLQVGAATFWWENPSGQPAYQKIRVGFGSSGPFSSVDGVTLADLPAPSVLTNSGPQIAATASSGTAAPVDTGIDQAPLSVQVLSTNSSGGSGPALPANDPSYQRIYYRENLAGTLITNLFPTGPGADLSTFIGVSPYAGAYPNNGSAGGGGQSTTFDGFHYVATTSTIDQNILGYLANNSNPPVTSQLIDVHGSQIAPINNTNQAAGGFTLTGCADFSTGACPLAPVTTNPTTGAVTPAMYLNTTSGLQIGLLTNLQATTAVQSLPLQHAPGTSPHLLHSAPLSVSTPTSATFSGSTPFTTNDFVDTYLVTHGILVPIANIPF